MIKDSFGLLGKSSSVPGKR